MGGCQNYGLFLGALYNTALVSRGDPKGDHNFDNHPHGPFGLGLSSRTPVGVRAPALAGAHPVIAPAREIFPKGCMY